MTLIEDFTREEIAKILRDDLDNSCPGFINGNEECTLEDVSENQFRLKIQINAIPKKQG